MLNNRRSFHTIGSAEYSCTMLHQTRVDFNKIILQKATFSYIVIRKGIPVRIKETPFGQGEFGCKTKRRCPGAYTYMHKERVRIKEAPFRYTYMHKKRVRIKERRNTYGI